MNLNRLSSRVRLRVKRLLTEWRVVGEYVVASHVAELLINVVRRARGIERFRPKGLQRRGSARELHVVIMGLSVGERKAARDRRRGFHKLELQRPFALAAWFTLKTWLTASS